MMVPMQKGENDATDEDHVHVEDYLRNQQTGLKEHRRDLLGRYDSVENCVDPTGTVITLGKDSLLVMANNKLAFAA